MAFVPSRETLDTVLITGAAGAIGRATVGRLLRDGYRCVAVDIDRDGLEALRVDFGLEPDSVLCADLADIGSVTAELTTRGLDREVDALVNNAASVLPASLRDVTMRDFDAVISVNLRSAIALMQWLALALERRSCPGAIVNVASIAGEIANARTAAYGASKAGLISITRLAAMEFGYLDIRANAVSPGSIATPMQERLLTPEGSRSRMARIPLGRFGDPTEVASAIAFLLSRDASYITGSVIHVDGGFLAAGNRDL